MTKIRVVILTSLAMLAFAGNSLLCRVALKSTQIDATSFTSIRLISGALVLWLLLFFQPNKLTASSRISNLKNSTERWYSALLLFIYAAGFSFAYINLSTATGALLLFGAVQISMLSYALVTGERFSKIQSIGLSAAIIGVIALLSPGVTSPPLFESLIMITAGIAWGAYSIKGKGALDPVRVTAKNFTYTTPFIAVLIVLTLEQITLDVQGVLYAILSGGLASGVGYAIWYQVLPKLTSANAATIQLSVPVISAIGGTLLLGEHITGRLALTSIIILGGIALVIAPHQRPKANVK